MTEPIPAGTDGTCGCCSGTSARTPGTLGNRPGLTEIAYRSGVHGDFRSSMVTALSDASRPGLARLLTRDPGDPTIALIDAWAVVCDVLTFYNERLANESYLRTATERASLQELGRLVAYRLAPGVAAETHLAFSLEKPPETGQQTGLPPDPGLLPPAPPAAVDLLPGLRVQSVPGPGEAPQLFETVEELTARAEWNALPVVPTKPHPPVRGSVDAWFDGDALALRPGDAILFATDDLAHDTWDVRLVTAVEPDPANRRTHVRWDGGIGRDTQDSAPVTRPGTFVLRRRLRVFGHNAPVWRAMNEEFRKGYAAVHGGNADDNEWPAFHAVTELTESGETVVDLDGSQPDIVAGSWVVLSQESVDGGTDVHRELFEVVDRTEFSRAEFAVSGTVTRLRLKGEQRPQGARRADGQDFRTPRGVTVLGLSEPLTVVEAPDPDPVTAPDLLVEGDATAMLPGRRLVLSGRLDGGTGEPAAEVVVLDSARDAGDRTLVTLTEPPRHRYRRATAVLFGNVVKATHGETVHQVLGDGDARRPFQTMPLLYGPLTHVRADTPQGFASTLTVRADDVARREVPTLYGAGPGDRVCTTRDEPDGSVVVAFGDGVHGARLPSGSHNIRATYRKGTGRAGNLPADRLSQLMDRPLGVKAVTNPVAADGGVDPEDQGHARASVPLATRTLGRAVALRDYADFALAFAGISLARADVLRLRAGRTIVVSVCGPEGDAAPAVTVAHLTAALRRYGDPLARVEVLPARQARFRLGLKVRVDPDREAKTVLAAVETALRAAHAPLARGLAAPVHRSRVVAVAASVPGVVAVDLDLLYRDRPGLESRLVAAEASVDTRGRAVAAEVLALSEAPFDRLQEMP
ncbi:putative baseplate assembly protein [Kitasatospora sp. DSM 101779]|uniref:putative baseplate assembly protein n=1 Tax=Kitasatospora sp. DSM 101779 TaxID=2853165 RepID=UPI0021D824B7|nr:putative baseplate assembly protein [Kitasatospora sp. DSM 101779]MCU7820356.1 putative baseplate assembly protein [Kitasatospora sp. DSM 101779]